MTDPSSPQLDLRARGWRQGSILPPDVARDLSTAMPLDGPLGEGDLLVVVTHDCDICHDDITKEPAAELILLRRIEDSPSGDRTFMRNPRLIEFEARIGDDTAYFRVKAHERDFVSRARLWE